MAAIWKTIFKEVPTDNQVVWIRVISVYGELALATWDETNQTFTTITTSIVIPATQVSRWKNQ